MNAARWDLAPNAEGNPPPEVTFSPADDKPAAIAVNDVERFMARNSLVDWQRDGA